ncbi:MAG: TauD/TfdA family dioxygenase [Actinomycetota bacterium]
MSAPPSPTTPATAALSACDLVAVDATEVHVHLDGAIRRLNRFWLRDNCPSNGDRTSLFRPFNVASMADDLTIDHAAIVDGELEVTFGDGCADRFDIDLLASSCPRDATPDWRPWRADHTPTTVEFRPDLADGSEHHRLLDALRRDGFALVAGLPDDPSATETVSSWLGPIRATDFGRIFDIVTESDPFTPSQSESALDPHTDDPYRYHPPGISILHCMSPCDGHGGASTVTDGFAIARSIAVDDPEAFHLLTTIDVPYVHRRDRSVEQGAAVDLRAAAPVISLDRGGHVCGVRFHERSMAPLQLDADLVDAFYRALMLFSRRALSSDFSYQRRLSAGEAIVYDNQRVLHGRSAITGASGRRHLRLCTVDRDQVHSRLRRLCVEFDPQRTDQSLAAGSAS